jgi:hypothetical protein
VVRDALAGEGATATPNASAAAPQGWPEH